MARADIPVSVSSKRKMLSQVSGTCSHPNPGCEIAILTACSALGFTLKKMAVSKAC